MKPTHGTCDQYMAEGQPCSGWQAQQAEIERLRGAMAADDERLRTAGQRVGIIFGCDTPAAMADEIERLRALLRLRGTSKKHLPVEPLEVEEIDKLAWDLNVWNHGTLQFDYRLFARLLEKRHGIK